MGLILLCLQLSPSPLLLKVSSNSSWELVRNAEYHPRAINAKSASKEFVFALECEEPSRGLLDGQNEAAVCTQVQGVRTEDLCGLGAAPQEGRGTWYRGETKCGRLGTQRTWIGHFPTFQGCDQVER